MLAEVLAEMHSAGRSHSLLSLYSAQNFYLDRSLYRGRFYAEYPIKYFFGGQAGSIFRGKYWSSPRNFGFDTVSKSEMNPSSQMTR